ncbi:MAG: class I SAM-dependent methyltransferase [Akkermansia sp.]|nr:class I SAM-dependent methyltransferase [Akkermansia sp.]
MAANLQDLLAARRAMVPADSDAYRVSDGVEWRGVFIDTLADRLLVSLRDVALPRDLEAQLRALGRPVYVKQLERDDKAAPQQLCGPEVGPRFNIRENGVAYIMDMAAGYSQGIFLDQRENRARLRRADLRGKTLLNTFSYTGAFSVCAALAGATTTTLDLAQPCLTWCKENFALNGLDPTAHYFCKGDVLHWLDRFAKQGRVFDLIVLDPPTFSRDAKGHIWRVERDYGKLVAKAAACLAPHGQMLCSTNCRKLTPAAFRAQVASGIPGARLTAVPMPPDFDGEQYLKCIWAQR